MGKDVLSLNDNSEITINSIREFSNFHVEKVEVFTGDDNFHETDCVEIHAKDKKLLVKKHLEYFEESNFRLRSEPGVRIYLNSEDGVSFYIEFAHHKGQTNLRIFEYIPQADGAHWECIL